MDTLITPEAAVPTPATGPEPAPAIDYLREMEEREAKRVAMLTEMRARLLNELRLLGATTFEGEYDGAGDSGEITSLVARNGEAEITLPEDMIQRLDSFVWDTAYACHPGFENNEGGYGTLTWKIQEDAITLDHGTRYVEVAMSVSEL